MSEDTSCRSGFSPTYNPNGGPNIGHVDSPEFRAREAAWDEEWRAKQDHFLRWVNWLMEHRGTNRYIPELRRYRDEHGEIAARELHSHIEWRVAGMPRDWASPALPKDL